MRCSTAGSTSRCKCSLPYPHYTHSCSNGIMYNNRSAAASRNRYGMHALRQADTEQVAAFAAVSTMQAAAFAAVVVNRRRVCGSD